jgi:tetratricopeptide (TPR) repeat protein
MDLPFYLNTVPGISALLFGLTAVVFVLRKFNMRQQQVQRTSDLLARINHLDQIIRVDPSNAIAFWEKGQLHEAMGHHEQALRLYRTAHLMCPKAYSTGDYVDAYERLSTLSTRLNSKSRIQSVSRS